MRLGQCSRIAGLFNGKASRSVGTLQILETVDGDTRRSSGELEKTRFLLRIPAADDLPEVLDNIVLLLVAAVVRVLLPVVHVDVGNTTNEQLQFTLIEDVDQIRRDQLVETGHERVELLLDPLDNLPLRNQSKVTSQPAVSVRHARVTHSMYCGLFSLVTGISRPPGIKSIVRRSPNFSSSTENVSSTIPSISLSLERQMLAQIFWKKSLPVSTYKVHAKFRCRSSSTPSMS